jgi:hypothetical protein
MEYKEGAQVATGTGAKFADPALTNGWKAVS